MREPGTGRNAADASVRRWLTFGLSAEQEERYRQAHLAADLAQARICISLVLAPLIVFAVNDFGFLGLSWRFYGLQALRLALLGYSLLLLKWLRGATSHRAYDRAEFVWGLIVASFVIATAATRPQTFVVHAVAVVVAVFMTVLALPNRFVNQITLSLIYTVGDTLVIAPGLWASRQAGVTVLLSMFAANSIAIASGWQLHAWRRREFLAREEERKAKAEAESQLAERQRAEEALRLAKEDWERTFDSVPDLIALLDDQHRIRRVNRAMARRLDRQPEECVGLPCHVAVHGSDTPPGFCPHTQTLSDGQEHTVEVHEERLGGDFIVSTTPLAGAHAGLVGTVHVARDITGRKRAEEALRESEERLRLFVDHSPASLAMLDRQMRYLRASRKWLSDYNLGDRDLRGLSHYEVFPEIGEAWKQVHRRALSGEVVRAEADRIVRVDGSVQWLRWEVRPWREASGDIGGIVIFSEDITEAALAAERAREREQWLSLSQEAAGAGTWQWDLSSDENVWSDELWKLYGLTKGSRVPSQETWREVILPEDRERATRAVRHAAEQGGDLSVEFRVRRGDGAVHHLLAKGKPLRDEAGTLEKYIGIVIDITERKLAEAERDKLAQQRKLALDAAHLGWWHYDPVTRIAAYDERYAEIFGLAGPPRLYDEILRLLHPEDLPRVRATVEAALDPGDPRPFSIEYRVRRPDGSLRWVEAHGAAIFEGESSAWHATSLVSTVADITVRKQALEALRESEERLRLLGDNLPESAVYQYARENDGSVRFLHVSAGIERLNRVEVQDVLRDPGTLHRQLPPEYLDRLAEAEARSARELCDFDMEVPMRRPDGEVRWMRLRSRPRRLPDGRTIWDGVQTDVTERRRMEEALRDADRRKTEFLAVLSHELRNPLAPIMNSLYLLDRAPPGSEQAVRARGVIRRQTEHLARLVDDLLDVTRISRGKVELHPTRIDARDVVRRTCDDHRALFHNRSLELRVEISDPVWIEGDETRIAQVVGNLLQNAAKFSHEGGTVMASVGAAGDRAEIRVSDNGIGIASDLLPRVFEPFVQAEGGLARTKGGLGLGLALVKGLVELHGGAVSVRSEAGQGSEFVVALPLAPAPARSAPAPLPAARTRALEILVIEDNVDAAQSIAEVLEMEGHRVHVATDGLSGITKARELRPMVVLCDIGLPDLDGYQIARTLRADGLRATRLIALSGYAQPEDRQRAKEAGFDDHVAKPPSLDALLASVARGAGES